jgi:hypothetical protein
LRNLKKIIPVSYGAHVSSLNRKVGTKFDMDTRWKYNRKEKDLCENSPGPANYDFIGSVESK